MSVIRPATVADSRAIAFLVSQLGYPSSTGEVEERLGGILRDQDYATFVAEEGDRVMGVAGIRLGRYYERNGVYAQLVVLAVENKHRGGGTGHALVDAAESWA